MSKKPQTTVNTLLHSHYVSSPMHSPRHNPNNRSTLVNTHVECIRLLFFHYLRTYQNPISFSRFQEMPCLWDLSALLSLSSCEQDDALNMRFLGYFGIFNPRINSCVLAVFTTILSTLHNNFD